MCLSLQATHLVVGTLGVLDEPIQAAEVAPARLDFDFTQAGKWGEYWTKMQVSGLIQQHVPSCGYDVNPSQAMSTYKAVWCVVVHTPRPY